MKPTIALLLVAALALPAVAEETQTPSMPRQGPMPAMVRHAAPPPADIGRGQVIMSWEEFVRVTGCDPARKENKQVLTIPWAEVESLLGVEIKVKGMDRTTVDLPWSEFKALLEWSVNQKKPAIEPPPPTDFIVASSQYEGTLADEAVQFTLTLKLNILKKQGWKRLPVLPASVAVMDSPMPEGVYLNASDKGYEILTEKSGPLELAIKFSVPVNKSAGIHSVAFDRVLPGSAVVDVKLAGQQADVKIGGTQSAITRPNNNDTHVLSALAAGNAVSITWQRALPKIEAAPTKLYAETRTLAAVAEGLLICQEQIDFSVLHTPVRELKLSVPKGVSVLEVSSPNLLDWRVDKEGVLLAVMRGEVLGPCSLRVSYEAPVTDKTEVPVIRAIGVERERGFVGVVALANVEVEPGKIDGASSVDVKALPAEIVAMTKQPILLGFRYVADKFTLPLSIRKHGELPVLVTIVDSALYTAMQLPDGRRMTRGLMTVRNNRNQFLRVQMPAGCELWSVSVGGNTVSPAMDDKKNVLIPLIRSSAGAAELASFPVELVYVEKPYKPAPASGKLRMSLPTLETPILHVMVNYYAPAEGKYGQAGGLFSQATTGFTGTLRLVNAFARMAAGGAAAPASDNARQAEQMQAQFQQRIEQQSKAAGVTPIRVQLPLDGRLFLLEKILALPGDDLFFELDYSNWKVAD